MKKDTNKKQFLFAGVLGGFTATTCCIAPIILILLGFGTAFGMAVMHQFHLISIVSGIVFMILLSLYLVKRKTGVCNLTSIQQQWKSLTFTLFMMIISLLAINYLLIAPTAAVVYGALPIQQKPLGNLPELAETHNMPAMLNIDQTPEGKGIKKLTLEIEGIFCGSCGPAIEYDLNSVLGVNKIEREGAIATITYDSDQTNKNVILAAIHDPYTAKLIKEEEPPFVQ